MNAHEHALELGAVRFDFDLSPAERRDLDGHLASCGQCRSQLAGMAGDARRFETRPARRMPPDAAAAVRARLERPARRTSPAMVLVAAVLVLVAALATLAVGAEIQRRLDDRRLAVVPDPSTQLVSPLPSPAVTPVVPTSWQLTSLGELSGLDFQPSAVARSELGWVAVGSGICRDASTQSYDCMLQVAVSKDGLRWEATARDTPLILGFVPPSSGPTSGMLDVAAGPDGYVAVGFGSGDLGPGNAGRGVAGTAWWSPDGRTWTAQRLDAGARPSSVWRAADRWLIGGVIYRDAGPIGAIWTSTDAHTWTLIDDPAVFDVGGYVDTGEDPSSGSVGPFAASGGTILAGGQVCADGGRPCAAAAWLSEDGLAWQRVALPVGDWTLATGATPDGFVTAVAECGDASDPCLTAILHSTDGRSWERVPGTLSEGAAAASSDGTVVVVAGGFGNLAVRVSADGSSWTDPGPVAASEQVSWGSPVLGDGGDGRVLIVARSNPDGSSGTGEDGGPVMGWAITPVR